MRLGSHPLHERSSQSRLADPRFTGEQHDLAFAALCFRLFAGSERGADRAAVMATLIMTAKLNDIDPQAWLADVLARINDDAIHRLDQLLPWNWAAAMERRWWEWSIPTAVSWHQGARGAAARALRKCACQRPGDD